MSVLTIWEKLTVPPLPQNATLAEKEKHRRANLTSRFALILFPLALIPIPLVAFNGIGSQFVAFILMLVLLTCSVIFNKRGLGVEAGAFLVASTFVSVAAPVVTPKQALDITQIYQLNYLLLPVVIAGALLPPVSTLIVGGLSCAVILIAVLFSTHTPQLQSQIQVSPAAVLAPTLLLQIAVAVLTYIVVHNLLEMVKRADASEERARLITHLADLERKKAEEGEKLQSAITTIQETHKRIANGDLSARVPTHEGNVLWSVAVPLNNLLSRAQKWRQYADLYEKTEYVCRQFAAEMHLARTRRQAIYFDRTTGLPIDPMLLEVNKLQENLAQANEPYVGRRPLA